MAVLDDGVVNIVTKSGMIRFMGGDCYYSNRAILGYPSLNSIQEFKVERNSYKAQFDGDGGIVTIGNQVGNEHFSRQRLLLCM